MKCYVSSFRRSFQFWGDFVMLQSKPQEEAEGNFVLSHRYQYTKRETRTEWT